jgi:CDP-paratose 2-epimerase
MKLLVTGGCGFLGSNLSAYAMELGWELAVFDNLGRVGSEQNLGWLKTKGQFRFVHGDIRNANDVTRIVRNFRPEVVFHLAGQVAMTTSIEDPRMDFETNALGSLNLLEAVRAYANDATVIYSSTNKVYGDLEQYRYEETDTRYRCVEKPDGFDEQTPLDFQSPYGCSKGAADQYLLDYARMFGLRTVVFRHSSMYGGRQFATYDQGWIGWFCQKGIECKQGRLEVPFTIAGTGKQVRDVLHADDMTRLYFSAVERIDAAKGQVFNIGGGIQNSLSLLELFALIESMAHVELRYSRQPPRTSDQRVFVADITKARKILGWEPQVTTRMGIERMLHWVEQTGIR